MAQSADTDHIQTEPGNQSPFIAIVVLVCGVVGGLVLVISVILCCKYCIKRKKVLRRQPVVFKKRPSPERNRRPYHLYVSLGPTSATDGATSKQEPKTSVKSTVSSASQKDGEDEECNIDFAVAMYKESLKGREESGSELHWSERPSDRDGSTDTPTTASASSSGSVLGSGTEGGRRVSVVILPGQPASWQHRRHRRRYTEGDFQHLKKIKLERLSGSLGKPRSGGLPLSDSSREPRYEPYGASSEDDHKDIPEGSGEVDLFADATTPMLETLVEESPSPPGKPHHTEVSVEVHREASSSTGSGSGSGSTCKADSTAACSASPAKVLDSNGNHTTASARHSQSLETVSIGDRLMVKENRRVKSFEEELNIPEGIRGKSSESSENSKESYRSKSSKSGSGDTLQVNEGMNRGRGRSFDGGSRNECLLHVPESRQRGRSFDGDIMRGDFLRIPEARRGRSFDGGMHDEFFVNANENLNRSWGRSFDSCSRIEIHVPSEPRRGKSFESDERASSHGPSESRSGKTFESEPRKLHVPLETRRGSRSFDSDFRISLQVPLEPRRGRSFDGGVGGNDFFYDKDSGRSSRGKSSESGMQLHVPEARRGRSFDAGTRGGLLPPERRRETEASSNNFLNVQENKRGRSFDGDLRAGFNMNDTRRTKSSGADLFRIGINMNETRRGSDFRRGSRNLDGDVRARVGDHRRPSRSFEGESRSELKVFLDTRRARSFEEARDYDSLEITQFNRGPFFNADYDVMLEGGVPELRSKVRYNDTGSFEDVTEDHVKMLEDLRDVPMSDSDDTETLNGAQKYRELWNLRATLEEEEEDFSDTIRMEMTSSGGQSPDDGGQITTSVTTSFESNTDPVPEPSRGNKDRKDEKVKPGSSKLLHPNYENRRQTYRSILSKRLQPRTGSAENSFDSVDTLDTDGEVSESSRQEVTTTSFDSTTDNTDSTGDSAIHRLQQMRGDSGYKSLETQQTLPSSQEGRRHIHFALDDLSPEYDASPSRSRPPEEFMMPPKGISPTESPQRRYRSTNYTFDRRNGKTASKKRREYGRERQGIHLCETVSGEPETDSRSDQFSGDSFDENQAPSKFALFARFFKSTSKESKRPLMARDYSIDEKTNALFREFTRYDPYLEHKPGANERPQPRVHFYPRQRLTRKQTEPSFDLERRRIKLAPEMRSVSLGSDSSTSSVRYLSPQDSIEEEYPRLVEHRPVAHSARHGLSPIRPTSTIHEIPIIRLPEGEAGDTLLP